MKNILKTYDWLMDRPVRMLVLAIGYVFLNFHLVILIFCLFEKFGGFVWFLVFGLIGANLFVYAKLSLERGKNEVRQIFGEDTEGFQQFLREYEKTEHEMNIKTLRVFSILIAVVVLVSAIFYVVWR